jgi:beta-lactamase regulating signal transducer with metallopeptidase domain
MHLVDSLLTWLTTATLRGSVLVMVVLMLQWGLGRWMPARWRMALWLPVVLVLAAPLLPECRWSMEGSMVGRVANSTWCCPAASRDCGLGDSPSLVAPVSDRAQMGWTVIAGCWLLGGAWFLGVVGWSYLRAMGLLRRDAVVPGPMLRALLADAAAVAGIRRMPEVLLSERVSSPAVAGVLRPALLLPASFPAELSQAEAQLVLQHELLHIRRGDLWKNWLLCLLQAVHWFNPVAWLAVSRMRADCERACDEDVLARNGVDCLGPYGHALIKVAGGFSATEAQLGILRMASTSSELRARVRGIANVRRVHPAWAAAWICLIGVVTLAGATRSPGGLPQGVSFFGGGPSPAVTRAQGFLLPELKLRGVTIAEAVEEVQRQTQAVDPEGKGVRIWLTPEAAASAQGARISLSLRGVSAWQALTTMTNEAHLGMDGSGEVICVKWPFVTLTWLVTDEGLGQMGGEVGLRDWLKRQGVDFPAGSSVQLGLAAAVTKGSQMRRLTVRNSQQNLQRISALLSRPTLPSVAVTSSN